MDVPGMDGVDGATKVTGFDTGGEEVGIDAGEEDGAGVDALPRTSRIVWSDLTPSTYVHIYEFRERQSSKTGNEP